MSDWAHGLLLVLTVALACCALVGHYQVIGSSQAIVAALGDDVTLPCYVDPPLNVEELMVDWWRPDIPPDPTDQLSLYRYVHRYYEKRNVEDMQMSSYAGRTALFKDDLKYGNASLRIVNVKLSDQGRYRCILPQLGSATVVKLIVEQSPVETRMAETPLTTKVTSYNYSDSTQTTSITGDPSLSRTLSLAMAVWVIAVLCFGLSVYLLLLCRSYLPKYTLYGKKEGPVFLPVKPI